MNHTDNAHTEYHGGHTFTRCHKCANHLLSSALNNCLRHGALKPDNEPCVDDEPLHSGNIHDETDAIQKGVLE